MPVTYQYLISPNVVDGLLLAGLHSSAQAESGPGSPLMLVASDDPGCALAFGFHIPANYTGISGLLAHRPDDLAVQVANGSGGESLQVIFPNRSQSQTNPYAILLDQLRFRLEIERPVTVVLDYRSLSQSLPPMYPKDEIRLFWEVRELLTESDLEAFQYLGERIEYEQPAWSPIRLYSRERPVGAVVEARAEQIRATCGFCSNDPVISL